MGGAAFRGCARDSKKKPGGGRRGPTNKPKSKKSMLAKADIFVDEEVGSAMDIVLFEQARNVSSD
jgi:hypothetical protein